MDGYEATKIIRALNDPRSRIPIIAMTANAFEEDRQRAFEAGMDAHIAKPIDVKILFSTLAQVLGRSSFRNNKLPPDNCWVVFLRFTNAEIEGMILL